MHKRIVLLILDGLPAGRSMNVAAMLMTGMSKIVPDFCGSPVTDGVGVSHPGIGTTPVIIMKARNFNVLQRAYGVAREKGIPAVPFFEKAAGLQTYEEYTAWLQNSDGSAEPLLGLALYGSREETSGAVKRCSLWK
ncbi:MAG: DUF2000 domain-containing protein [Bacillota bacterium]